MRVWKAIAALALSLAAGVTAAAEDPGRAVVQSRMLGLVRDTALRNDYTVTQFHRLGTATAAPLPQELRRLGLVVRARKLATEPLIADWTGRAVPNDAVVVNVRRGPGNAALAAAMGAIKTFNQLRLKPRRTVRLVIWDGAVRPAGAAPGALRQVALIDGEMTGTPSGVRADLNPVGLAALEPLRAALEPMGAGRIQLVRRGPADPLARLPTFALLGRPVVAVESDALRRQAALLATLAWQLGEMAEPLQPPRAPERGTY